jgi:hypothetical protein
MAARGIGKEGNGATSRETSWLSLPKAKSRWVEDQSNHITKFVCVCVFSLHPLVLPKEQFGLSQVQATNIIHYKCYVCLLCAENVNKFYNFIRNGHLFLFCLCYIDWFLSEGSRRLHNEELHNLYTSPNIFTVIESMWMRWAGDVERLGKMRRI